MFRKNYVSNAFLRLNCEFSQIESNYKIIMNIDNKFKVNGNFKVEKGFILLLHFDGVF